MSLENDSLILRYKQNLNQKIANSQSLFEYAQQEYKQSNKLLSMMEHLSKERVLQQKAFMVQTLITNYLAAFVELYHGNYQEIFKTTSSYLDVLQAYIFRLIDYYTDFRIHNDEYRIYEDFMDLLKYIDSKHNLLVAYRTEAFWDEDYVVYQDDIDEVLAIHKQLKQFSKALINLEKEHAKQFKDNY